MSDKTDNYTEADIHRFTDRDGIERVHIPWGMITGDIPDNVIYPTDWSNIVFVDNISWHWDAYPTADEEPFALIPADRIEVVTEHVPATVLDALQALVASGGKPVDGWRFLGEERDEEEVGTLVGVAVSVVQRFESVQACYPEAYRPVTRVRINPEVKPEPGYGYTLDGNPVPPPPEGWEIVPEGEKVGKDAKFYHGGDSEWVWSVMGDEHGAMCGGEVRAYARRVVKESLTPEAPATAEDSSVVGDEPVTRAQIKALLSAIESAIAAFNEGGAK